MPFAHRDKDSRDCGASTIVSNQKTTKVNGKLWAVEGDPNDHGNGALIYGLAKFGNQDFKIEGKGAIVKGDSAKPDDMEHSNPKAEGASSDTKAGG
jgi:uncharacterized Zn-binding protein involved in type VI secretion